MNRIEFETLQKKLESKSKEFNEIIELLYEYISIFKRTTFPLIGKSLPPYYIFFLDILKRFRFNIESVIPLFKLLINDYRNKLALNLIFRSIASDLLTIIYLLSFYDQEDETGNQTNIINELKIIDKDLGWAFYELIHMRNDYLKYGGENDDDFKQALRMFTEQFEGVINIDSNNVIKFKTNQELRKTTTVNSKAFGKGMLSEKAKFKRLEEVRGFWYSYGYGMFIHFKYFSQFQHISFRGQKLMDNDPIEDIKRYADIIELMIRHTNVVFQMIDHNEILNNEMENLLKKIDTMFRRITLD